MSAKSHNWIAKLHSENMSSSFAQWKVKWKSRNIRWIKLMIKCLWWNVYEMSRSMIQTQTRPKQHSPPDVQCCPLSSQPLCNTLGEMRKVRNITTCKGQCISQKLKAGNKSIRDYPSNIGMFRIWWVNFKICLSLWWVENLR